MSIEAKELYKSFDGHAVLKNVSLTVRTGELLALLGPSGSGKTTVLRILAGLESADSGSVRFHGADVTEKSAHERKAGFVFQHYALFPHLNVFENVAFGLRVRPRATRPKEADLRARVLELLRLVQLESHQKLYPNQLSGGQRQRIALARALAAEPAVLLLDEPFGALDAKVRKELRTGLRKLHDETKLTTVFVTHDQEEAFDLADRVVIFGHGEVAWTGAPGEIGGGLKNDFVADFLGRDI